MSSIVVPAKLLTVVQLIPALHSGGAERSALEIARALVQAGHRSVVISAGGRLVEQLQAEGSEHVMLDMGRKSLRTLLRLGALRRLLRDLKPDIVHARSRLPAWLGWWALSGVSPRPHFVTTVHGLNSPGRYSAILLRGERVIAVSQTMRDFVLSHYKWLEPAKVRVIPRGIDPEAFPYGHRPEDAWQKAFFAEYPTLAGAPLLTLPARGTRLKGHHDAIEL
ncbi:MAG TPA: glycosyltransferase, partial [Rhodanobacter sp.]